MTGSSKAVAVTALILLSVRLLAAGEAKALAFEIDPEWTETVTNWVWDIPPMGPFEGMGHWETEIRRMDVSISGDCVIPFTRQGVSYSFESHGATIDLDPGQTSAPIEFFDVTFGGNTQDWPVGIRARIPLVLPEEILIVDDGSFQSVVIVLPVDPFRVLWGSPLTYQFGPGGTHSVTLDLFDVPSVTTDGGSFSIMGTVTYAVVPEPSTALLLGSGLIGLAVNGRRRR